MPFLILGERALLFFMGTPSSFILPRCGDVQEGATSFQSKLRDTYQRSFIHMTAIAACNLFRAAAPRSAPLFDEQFLRAVMRQLRIWTSGLLPADAYQSSASAIQGSGAMQKKSDASQRQPVWRTLRQKHPAARHACDEAATQAARASPGSEDSDALPKLPGKAARGGFDIAKTSPFVAYFLEHHDLKPNDLHRGLLGRHVFRTHKQHQAQGEEEEEEAPCASYAEGPTAASKNAVREYEKSTRKAVRSSLSASKRLQRDLAELRFQQAAVSQT